MPIYEYGCHHCKKFVDVIVRRVPADGERFRPPCPICGGRKMTRMVSRFAFHLSMKSKLDSLDPRYDRMIDAANPDLSFENLVKQYSLDRPMSTPAERKAFKEKGGKGLVG